LAFPPAPPTACFTASTFECLLPEPFECDAPFEPVALLAADFDLAFAALGFAFDAFGLDDDLAFEAGFDFDDDFVADDFARFGADRFFGLVFA